jgi:hypothetical protein
MLPPFGSDPDLGPAPRLRLVNRAGSDGGYEAWELRRPEHLVIEGSGVSSRSRPRRGLRG